MPLGPVETAPIGHPPRYNIVAVVQAGRLQYEAILLAASLRASNPDFAGKLYLLEPHGPRWNNDPRVTSAEVRALLESLGAEFIPFENKVFGAAYPYGNKIEGLAALPAEPFLFLDTDTLITGDLGTLDFNFNRPSASMKREGTWPEIPLYGPNYDDIWGSLYAKFGLDFAPTLDLRQPDQYWQRYMYFNAGWFFGDDPQTFGARFTQYAREIRDTPPETLVCQEMFPWLDQVALPLVIASFGGGRPGPELAGLDGAVTCHWRTLSLLYARESDAVVKVLEDISAPNKIKKILRDYEPFKKLVLQGKGAKARALFDRTDLPKREHVIRNTLKREGLWFR